MFVLHKANSHMTFCFVMAFVCFAILFTRHRGSALAIMVERTVLTKNTPKIGLVDNDLPHTHQFRLQLLRRGEYESLVQRDLLLTRSRMAQIQLSLTSN